MQSPVICFGIVPLLFVCCYSISALSILAHSKIRLRKGGSSLWSGGDTHFFKPRLRRRTVLNQDNGLGCCIANYGVLL